MKKPKLVYKEIRKNHKQVKKLLETGEPFTNRIGTKEPCIIKLYKQGKNGKSVLDIVRTLPYDSKYWIIEKY